MKLAAVACALACAASAFAACSSPTPPPEKPFERTTATAATDAVGPSASASVSAAPPPDSFDLPPPEPSARFVEVRRSKMLDRVRAAGLDPSALPELDALEPAKRDAMMPLFVEALGLSGCEGCHVAGDKKTRTRRMQIAEHMWNHFAKELRTGVGDPLFCDSCHAGRTKLFDRSELETDVRGFMQMQYVDRLERRDGKSHGCETCHGSDLILPIFDRLWKVKR